MHPSSFSTVRGMEKGTKKSKENARKIIMLIDFCVIVGNDNGIWMEKKCAPFPPDESCGKLLPQEV
jgi:hypothetical protein